MPPTVGHTFPMTHGGANKNCQTCHPSQTKDWTCYGCHNQSELEKRHREEGLPAITGLCMQCHWDGRKHD